MTSIGVPRFVVRQLLNHVDAEITSVYDRYAYDREKRDALDRWARHLRAMRTDEKKPGAEIFAFARA